MNVTCYRNYQNSSPTEFIMDDGSVWREATRQELADARPDMWVLLSLAGEPELADKYAKLRFPGNYPFLPGVAALRPVYVRVL